MPELIAINNAYTANTPSGVRECLHFLQQQCRVHRNRGIREVDVFRPFPISIVYGRGDMNVGELVTVGDDLDIVSTRWDRVRRRRWWNVSGITSKQMLLPFSEHARVRITSMNWYSHATEVVIQISLDRHSQLNLTAPTGMDTPVFDTIRAIRIHNVDHTETVSPMQSVVDESGNQMESNNVSAVAADARYIRANRVSDHCHPDDIGRNVDIEWHTAVEPNPCRERPARPDYRGEPGSPCNDPPASQSRRFNGEARCVPLDELTREHSHAVREMNRDIGILAAYGNHSHTNGR